MLGSQEAGRLRCCYLLIAVSYPRILVSTLEPRTLYLYTPCKHTIHKMSIKRLFKNGNRRNVFVKSYNNNMLDEEVNCWHDA